MSGSPIVGFSAAAPANGLGLGLGVLSKQAEAVAAPGGFAKLLAALLGTGGAPTAEAAAAAAAALAPDAGETVDAVPPAVVDPQQGAVENPAVPDKLSAAVAPLLLDLVRALSALDTAVQGGQPVELQLHQELDQALEALASYLGGPATLDSQPAPPLAAPALPATAALPLPEAATPPVHQPAPGAPPPRPEEAAARPAVPPTPLLARLAEKLQSIGEALETSQPNLAERLRTVVERLTSVEPQKLAALGLDLGLPQAEGELAKALELLLRPAPPPRPAVAPQPFTAASLVLPPELGAPPSEKPPLATPRQEAPAPASPEPQKAEPAPANRPVERQAAEAPSPVRTPAASAATAPPPAEAEAQPAGGTTAAAAVTAATAAATRTVHAAYQSPPQQLNVPQVAFEMVRQFQAGNSRFQIRLDPPELGRIDVRMDMDRDGNVMARMTVERSETLDLMQRDQRALERALAQAGLDSARTSLEFSLRQQGSGREQREGHGQPVFGDTTGGGTSEPEAPPPTTTHHRGSASPGGLNLFV